MHSYYAIPAIAHFTCSNICSTLLASFYLFSFSHLIPIISFIYSIQFFPMPSFIFLCFPFLFLILSHIFSITFSSISCYHISFYFHIFCFNLISIEVNFLSFISLFLSSSFFSHFLFSSLYLTISSPFFFSFPLFIFICVAI